MRCSTRKKKSTSIPNEGDVSRIEKLIAAIARIEINLKEKERIEGRSVELHALVVFSLRQLVITYSIPEFSCWIDRVFRS